MTPRAVTPQSCTQRARKPVRIASILVLLVAVAGLQWPALPVTGQAGPDLPAVEQAAAPSESHAPSADTDLWQVDRVEVVKHECGVTIREDDAPLSLRELTSSCGGKWDWGTAEAKVTMQMVFPHQMQGYNAEIELSASGSGKWKLNDPNDKGQAVFWAEVRDWLKTTYKPNDWYGKCRQEYTDSKDGGSSGSGEFSVAKLECTYDPAVEFAHRNEVKFSFKAGAAAGDRWDNQGPGVTVNVTYKRCTNPEDCKRPRKPVLILHGIHGSYVSSAAHHEDWVLRRGVYPNWLVIDPISRTYDDLIQTLKNVGYVEGKDLFIVAYDWRMAPAPAAWSNEIIDGHVDGPTGQSITDDIYWYGVDYLGHWLKEAAEAWQRDNSEPLVSVDVIAHSAGGLVARSYIQSNAYGDTFSSQGKTMRLPLIDNLIMVAVPNRGASLPWQAMHNNFIYDTASRQVYSKMLNVAYQKVKAGKRIAGFPPINPEDIQDSRGNFVADLFVRQYVWTYRSLLATYPFYVGENDPDDRPSSLNHDPMIRNNLLLDLNNGFDMPDRERPADASPFADEVGATTVIYAKNQTTPYRVREARGPAFQARWPIDAWLIASNVPKDGTFYQDIVAVSGDGTVPKESAVGQFEGDSRVDIKLIATGDTTHTGLMSNKVVQQRILEKLGVEFEKEDISTGSVPWQITQLYNAHCAISDPVEMFLVDGSGRRLGYSQGTGAVTEIPSSVWFGDADGIGWVFDAVQGPLSVKMTGLGEDYYVQVSGEQVGMTGGMEASGTLAKGQKKTVAVETQLRGTRTFLPMIQRNHKLPPAPTPDPGSGIFGQVTKDGEPAAGLDLDLEHWDGTELTIAQSTTTGPDGRYLFSPVAGLSPGQDYSVRYRNTYSSPNPGPGYLYSWSGEWITEYQTGTALPGGDFDLADIVLNAPADGATVTLPAQFCWQPRSILSDNYVLEMDYPGQAVAESDYLGHKSCFTLAGLPEGWPSGAEYGWWVRAYQGQDPDSTPFNHGDSYGYREVTIHFSAQSQAPESGSAIHLAPPGESDRPPPGR